MQKKLCSDPRDLHRIDDVALRNAEYRRRWPPGDDPLAREAGAQRCAPACGLVRMLTHAERLAGPEANRGGGHKAGSVAALRRNDAASVIGRYARTTLVWKAQARALIIIKNRIARSCWRAAARPLRARARGVRARAAFERTSLLRFAGQAGARRYGSRRGKG